jgi:PiT family inorganic phosphate transporter
MLVLVLLILVALAFNFMNGLHDAAKSIATVVSTRVFSLRVAVVWAAFFNFVAAFGFGVAVATTIGQGIVHPEVVDSAVIFSALVAAFLWDLITWHYGLPSSSSHALIAGLAGAGATKGGLGALLPAGLLKVVVFIVVSPLVGFVLGATLMLVAIRLVHRAHPATIDRSFRRLQLVSAAFYSLGHGTNDAQRRWASSPSCSSTTATAASTSCPSEPHLPRGVGLGTMFGAGIVRTMGMRPRRCSRSAASAPDGGRDASWSATLGIPGAPRTITGAIVGVGARGPGGPLGRGAGRGAGVVLTIPCTAAIAALIHLPFRIL